MLHGPSVLRQSRTLFGNIFTSGSGSLALISICLAQFAGKKLPQLQSALSLFPQGCFHPEVTEHCVSQGHLWFIKIDFVPGTVPGGRGLFLSVGYLSSHGGAE